MKIKTTSFIAYVLTSFILYATAVCLLEQHRTSQYNGEQFIIASAVSHTLLGTPIGSVYWGIVKQFVYQPVGTIQTTISNISSAGLGQTDLGPLWTTLPDGLGIVMVALVSVMFRLFGVSLAAFPALAILVSAATTIAFCVRFRDARLLVIPFHFFILTALLLSPFTTETLLLNEVPIGGLRYFGLIAILPAFHILFEVFDRRLKALSPAELIATAFQIFVFGLSLNIRSSSVSMLCGILTLVLIGFWIKGTLFNSRIVVSKLCGVFSMLALTAMLVAAAAPADYRAEGRITGVVWHRILISLGVSPVWPFGDLVAHYNRCALPYSPPLMPNIRDSNGGCIWTQYVLENNLSPGELVRGIGSASYEHVIRNALWKISKEYPREVFETFAYYKSDLILGQIKRFMTLFSAETLKQKYPLLIFCVIAQALMLFAAGLRQSPGAYWQMTGGAALFLVWSIFPLVLVWGAPQTMMDFAYWCMAAITCATMALVTMIKAVTQRSLVSSVQRLG